MSTPCFKRPSGAKTQPSPHLGLNSTPVRDFFGFSHQIASRVLRLGAASFCPPRWRSPFATGCKPGVNLFWNSPRHSEKAVNWENFESALKFPTRPKKAVNPGDLLCQWGFLGMIQLGSFFFIFISEVEIMAELELLKSNYSENHINGRSSASRPHGEVERPMGDTNF